MGYCIKSWVWVMIFWLISAQITYSQGPLIEKCYPTLSTAILYPIGLPTTTPFIPLIGGGLTFRFDDLEADYKSYNLRIIHCTHDWWPSDLHPSEYIDGFYEIVITEMEDSFGSMVNYTHYKIDLPSVDMQWTRSGNYCIEVYDPSVPEEVLIRKRFVVFENLCLVEGRVKEPIEVSQKRTHQEVLFSVFEDGYSLLDPYSNLYALVLQNGRWDNAIGGLQPRFIKGRELDFSNVGYVFPGGNSFRFADLKSLSFTARGIAGISKGKFSFNHLLEPSERRTYKYHSYRPDINGRFVISNDRFDAHTGSDYTRVHFNIPMPYKLHGREIFVFGDISGGRYLDTHKLDWDDKSSSYKGSILLKQGYYDFLYLVKDEGESYKKPGETADLEGNHFATDNLYSIIIYYSDFEGYDRVVGFLQWNSRQQQ